MHRQYLRFALSSQEETRELVRASHEACRAGRIAIQEMRAAHDANREMITVSRVSIAETREAMQRLDALLLNGFGMKKG
jgi:hypothetical protein